MRGAGTMSLGAGLMLLGLSCREAPPPRNADVVATSDGVATQPVEDARDADTSHDADSDSEGSDGTARDDTGGDGMVAAPDAGPDGHESRDAEAEASDATHADDVGDAADATDTTDTADVEVGPTDDIFGVAVPRRDSWWVEDGTIHNRARALRLRGVNWFGLETPDRALHGTWFGRQVEDILREVRAQGFDSLRIPVSPDAINPGLPSAGWANNAYASGPATTGREHLDRLLRAAGDAGLWVLLDVHACSSAQQATGRPDGCNGYGIDQWLADLSALATIALAHDHVIGVDLFNEPHALTWSEWKGLAERGAESALRRNPRILVFVEGVGNLSADGGAACAWGENLVSAAQDPPRIPASRLVFSPHVYGPGVTQHAYFGEAGFPANMPAIWRTHFGHLVPEHALAVGEFGGHYDDQFAAGEVAWNDAFVAYLSTLDRGAPASFFYWALNANSGDTGGLYSDDWTTLSPTRLALLAPLLAP